MEDLQGNFQLQIESDPRYVGIYRNVRAPHGCVEQPDPAVGGSVEEMTEWLMSHEGLEVTQPEPVIVGGLNGVYIDISLAPSWTTTCWFSEGQPVVPFIIGGGPSSLTHVILPGFEERLYLLSYGADNIAIEVGPEGDSLSEYLDEVVPIIESLQLPINGTWHRAQTCAEVLDAFQDADLAESHRNWLAGFFESEIVPSSGDPCAGALGPLEHSHFFTPQGEFGSHDENGEQVDNGDYAVTDSNTLSFPSHAAEFGYAGELKVDFVVTGDNVKFEVPLPPSCVDTCGDAHAWALSAFASGLWEVGAAR